MKLLIVTQKVDKNDPILGFFHRWLEEFAKHYESITVICLESGQYSLPRNIKVLSLGKEEGLNLPGRQIQRFKYIFRFYKYAWKERRNYDAVFVHMNQEYVILGGILWRTLGKKVYMWRNHHAGSFFTNIAAFFCDKVFCTSKYSYSAKYRKTLLMPVGVDTDLFVRQQNVKRMPNSILFLGRIAPAKRPDLLIKALVEIGKQNIEFKASFYGDTLVADQKYCQSLKVTVRDASLSNIITFYPGVPNEKTVEIYNNHEIFVNLSSSGMYDKTIFEAMACETLVLASNKNLHGLIDEQLIFEEGNKEELVVKLTNLLLMKKEDKIALTSKLRMVVLNNHNLKLLIDKLKSIL